MKESTSTYRSLKSISAAALLLSASTTAVAHPGDHSMFSVIALLHHWVTQPSHIGLFVGAAVSTTLIGLVIRSRRSVKQRR